jgi:hypothetical protein
VMRTTFQPSKELLQMTRVQGINERSIGSWFQNLWRGPRVLVPMVVDALAVRTEGGEWANCTMSTPPSDGEQHRLDLLPAPFTNRAAPRARGIYLHWALPDGLTHGVHDDATGKVLFPAIPDRWLVARISPSTTSPARRTIRGWVLEAGSKEATFHDLPGWTEPGTPPADIKDPLTVMGHGDASWAGFYDNVENRLGFYDPLANVSEGPLAYMVCGWYADPTLDPLQRPPTDSLDDFNALMQQYGWQLAEGELDESHAWLHRYIVAAKALGLSFRKDMTWRQASYQTVDGAARGGQSSPAGGQEATPPPTGGWGNPYETDGSWWPEATLLHGAVVGIGWPDASQMDLSDDEGGQGGTAFGELGGPPDASSIQVVVGQTLADALGSLIATTNGSPDEARVLEAFQLGILKELEHPDGRARLGAQLHASGFGSLADGSTSETSRQPPTPFTPAPPANPPQPTGGVFPTTGGGGGKQWVDHGSKWEHETQARYDVETARFALANDASAYRSIQHLHEALGTLYPTQTPPLSPAQDITVKRARPRLYFPADPVVLLQGAQRTFKYGSSGRLSPDGSLTCRLTGFYVTQLACYAGDGTGIYHPYVGSDILEGGLENGSIPIECDDLLKEVALLDPGSAAAGATVIQQRQTGAGATQLRTIMHNIKVEQTAWHATRDPRVDHGPLIARSGITGMLPSPFSITPHYRPWNPLYLEWQVAYAASPDDVSHWELGEDDFTPAAAAVPTPDAVTVVAQGRTPLTGGAASTVAAAALDALKMAAQTSGTTPIAPQGREQFSSLMTEYLIGAMADITKQAGAASGGDASGGDSGSVDRSLLADVASTLEHMDVLSGSLEGFRQALRGDLKRLLVPPPARLIALRAGFMRLLRLRMVDGYGQVVNLAGSDATHTPDPARVLVSSVLRTDGHPELLTLPPRYTAPARLWFLFRDAGNDTIVADQSHSPVCGYVLPNHLDSAIEIFNADGSGAGEVRYSPDSGISWEDSPGVPSTAGQSPARALANPHCASIAQALVQWGLNDAGEVGRTENALGALLRVIDTTRWTVDPFGRTGEEHLALLVGHPIAVVRASLRLEVQETGDASGINSTPIPVRLGSLNHWQDGLFGYFVNDDYTTLYCVDPAAADLARPLGPKQGFLQGADSVESYYASFASDISGTTGSHGVTHPYVNTDGYFQMRPNQSVALTLLLEPHCLVHASCGMTPRKDIGLRREWITDALAKIAPTFRFGPVLVDPKQIRMPAANDIQGKWSWDHRSDASTWAEDALVRGTGNATLSQDPAAVMEGWLKISPLPSDTSGSSGTSGTSGH